MCPFISESFGFADDPSGTSIGGGHQEPARAACELRVNPRRQAGDRIAAVH
jgi:hypothetical protein